MIEIKNKGEYHIYLYFHVIYYFIIIYICHYFIFYKEKEDYIENNVKDILNKKEIYENFELKNSDKTIVDVIKKCNDTASTYNDTILYNIIMYVLIFGSSIVFMILIGNFYKKQIRRILYEGFIFFLLLFILKIFFIYNIELNFNRPSQKTMYDNITEVLNDNIKLK